MTVIELYRRSKKGHYAKQKEKAKVRGVEWKITFEEWNRFWGDFYHLRGKAGLWMCRLNDEGPYSLDNCYIGTPMMNNIDHNHTERYRYKPQ